MTRSSLERKTLPDVAFTIGDPHGIGAEVLLKALGASPFEGVFQPVVFGPKSYLQKLAADLGLGSVLQACRLPGEGDYSYPPRWGLVDEEAGRAAWSWLDQAIDYCLVQDCRLLITGPIHKQAIQRAGFSWPGHTEYLAYRFGCPRTVMAFFSEPLIVALVTIHLPLREVAASLTSEDVFQTAALLRKALLEAGFKSPRIALCGLNPHASEGGLFGDEEGAILEPAVQRFRADFGAGFEGPFPSDTLFHRARQGEFDAVVALYHDQGLIPVKLLAFDSSSNVTLGLPLVRASPDHGTAFDIAGQNRADPGSMSASIEWGLRLARLDSQPPKLRATPEPPRG